MTSAFHVRQDLNRVQTTTRVSPLVALSHFAEKKNDSFSSREPGSTDASLFKLIDDAGQGLKPAAAQANAKASLAPTTRQRYLYMIKSCLLYAAFILYRAYRGFFVILPAVFRETFRKLRAVVDDAPFDEVEEPNDAPMKWRTRATVSVLAAIVTASYVIGGAIRVATTLIRNVNKDEISKSFAAAASEQERNEDTILLKSIKRTNDINGQDPQQGLSP